MGCSDRPRPLRVVPPAAPAGSLQRTDRRAWAEETGRAGGKEVGAGRPHVCGGCAEPSSLARTLGLITSETSPRESASTAPSAESRAGKGAPLTGRGPPEGQHVSLSHWGTVGTAKVGMASVFGVADPRQWLPAASLRPPPWLHKPPRRPDTGRGHSLLTVLLGSFQKRSNGPQVALVSQEQCLDFPLRQQNPPEAGGLPAHSSTRPASKRPSLPLCAGPELSTTTREQNCAQTQNPEACHSGGPEGNQLLR